MALDRKLYKGFATSTHSQGAHDCSNSMMRSSKPDIARCARAFSIAMNYSQFHDLVMAAKAELEAYRAEQETPTTVDQTQNEAPKATKVIESGTVRIVKGDYQYNTLGNIIR